ncbi:MAG: glycosyltransferase [Desulfobacterales bacterium]|nr:glycosyltransferase [Desulfobacterales bacterium]
MRPHLTQRILILSASVGAGHVRAAEAIERALQETAPGLMLKNVDVLSLASSAFRRIYGKGYLDVAHRAPHLLGYVYDLLDRPQEMEADRFRIALQRMNLRPFLRLLESERWDVVVNTHFLPAEIIGSLRSAGKINVRQVTVTTDFMTHRMWVQPPCEHYFAATEESAANLEFWGVPARDITVSGIPVHPEFGNRKDRGRCLRARGLRGDRPILLLLSGGFGVGPMEQIFSGMLALDTAAELVVVCGRNEALRERLNRASAPPRHRVTIIGFTEAIDELMAVADVVISKPGGLTSAEVLCCGGAMLIVNPIPGQESRNADFLLENGAAVKVGHLATLHYKLNALLSSPRRLARLKANARRIARPQAAYEVATKVLSMLDPSARGARRRRSP